MRLIAATFLLAILRGTAGLLAPSYVSEWLWMDADNYTSTDVTLNHNFGVRPVKADVQVKSPNTGFIYPGVRSAHSQIEESKRGGVICLYGNDTVRLLGATNENAPSTNRAYIIYTGSTTWLSQNGEELTAAWVRVRLWNPADLPAPSYTISTNFAAEERSGLPNYLELEHNLGTLPVLTVVQYYSISSSSYFSTVVAEAQGTNSIQINSHDLNLRESSFVFGVNSSHIRLWAFNDIFGVIYGIFSFCKGWGYYTSSGCYFREANVDISIWTDLDASALTTQQVTHSVTDSSSHEYSTTTFDAELGLVTVTSTPVNGVNSGFEFDGTGAAMTDGIDNSAGLIYAYNEDGRVRLWHPLSPYCIIQVGPLMGADTNNQCAQEVNVTINVWRTGCPLIEVENAVATVTGDSITYECNSDSVHDSGDLERHCPESSTTWNGTLPTCRTGCPLIEVENAVATMTSSSITYECNSDSAHASGDLERHCPENSTTWNGTLPTCLKCATLGTGTSATLDTHLLRTQNIANFTCVDGYYLLSGNLTRTCGLPNATWSGAPPICTASSTTSASTTTTTVTTTTTSTVPPTTTSTTSTPATTTAPSVVEVCFNITNVVYNTTTLQQQTEEIIANLTIDATSTSKYERSKTSAQDSRSSSMYIGLVGYLIFGLMGAFILIPDCLSVLRYLICRSHDNYQFT